MKLTTKQLDDLKTLDLEMAKRYPYTPQSIRYIQFGFYHGDNVLFIGQNPGISQRGVPMEGSLELYTDFVSDANYEKYLSRYENVLHLPTCPLGNYIDAIYGSDWSDISFTNVYKNPFVNHKVDVIDNNFYYAYLAQQIDIIKPKIIFTIGKVPEIAIKELSELDISTKSKKIFAPHYSWSLRKRKYEDDFLTYKGVLKNLINGGDIE